MPSPGAGVIEELLVADGGKVTAGQQLFKLRLTGSFFIGLLLCLLLTLSRKPALVKPFYSSLFSEQSYFNV